MKAKFIPLLLCCGLLGLGSVRADDDTNMDVEQPAAPEAQAEANSPDDSNQVDATEANTRSGLLFNLNGDVELKKGETCPMVVVIGGNAVVDGTVDQNVIVIAGNLKLNGAVLHDTYVIGGSVQAGPKAISKGEIVVVGGALKRAESAEIAHRPMVIGFGREIQSAWIWVTHGLILGRPVVPSLPIVWMVLGAFFALYCLIALLFRNAAATTLQTIESNPIGSMLCGFLVLIILGIILSVLVLGPGVFLLPFILCGIFFATLVGKVAVYEFFGCLFAKGLRPPGLGSIVALTLGMALSICLCMIPFIGFMVWGLIGVLGLGSVTLACFRMLAREAMATRAAFVTARAPAATVAAGAGGGATFGGASETGAPPVIIRQPLAFPLAGFWPRAGALILDLIIVGGALGLVGALPAFPIALLVYSVGFLVWRGATIGCILIGTRCIRTNGAPLTWSCALVRTLASILSLIPFGLGFLWAAWDPHKQTWHDRIAGTLVVKIPPSFRA